MAEEVQMSDYRDYDNDDGDEERVHEWEIGLPTADDLTPLSQHLIPPELASAFSISPEPCRSMVDVNRASQNTITSLRRQSSQDFPFNNLKSLPSFGEENQNSDPLVVEGDENDPGNYANDGSDHTRKIRRLESVEEADSALRTENSTDNISARNLKRPRLVWTPQLHKRFVDVVVHLDIKNAVPKTIMQLMNVEGLTRENVASHLQKYRLYLKRMQGLSNEGPSSSDQLFASTPVAQSLQESGGHGHMPIPMMPYAAPRLMPMPILGVSHAHGGHMGMPTGNPTVAAAGYHGFESHPYNMFMEQQKNWSGYPHVTSNDK